MTTEKVGRSEELSCWDLCDQDRDLRVPCWKSREPRYQDVPLGSINSMGLPNQGLDYYLNYLLELQETDHDRTFFLSLVGMSPEETHTILKKVQDSDFKGLTELNLSLPNVPGKPQIAYDF